ncbi:Crp/Fnr family transcriptional regulator [Clostridium tagluense]|uniref:Crp/Fnr family transcriptional regulator n=1 Tax=Clostridium tagluense TaxID=360422 RepID=UPI001CF2EC82|nr:Crp/Fnr family transcriptional regulator [Clostridium tagluense]MCB2310840.1 Crp/Fnr family transcriptional regulator [Clostridium tagluense]MCB2315694.1 Crp/Fnr family transcriptional regulator [Clostridium tagluense]MCB2320662.1 Crp/Fnr family transcriptional regulator [Clostridium tagluense]MCB2325433.1 Crp/Fnr family transcriptional regulator [Clostridium tagluense]MCB2330286.1 Crp/Fnr family transcriptional regulator [Clostridium tagluense]
MYEKFFEPDRQAIMRDYFLNTLSKLGQISKYNKNELLDFDSGLHVGIVLKGVVTQSVISLNGHEKILYFIRSGEIVGEMIYFCGGMDSIVSTAKKYVEISIISQEVLERELSLKPQIYRYFMHSTTRKFRIVMLQLTNKIFNDARGQLADALLRLSSTAELDSAGFVTLNRMFTHEELSNIIGCSRITVTRCLNDFLKDGVILYDAKKIIINKPEVLKTYIELVVEE